MQCRIKRIRILAYCFSVGMEEDGFVYGYDDYNQQVLSYCKVMPLYEKLEIKNLFDHDKLELEYQYE